MLDKKDYIIKQLHRTHNKKYENYVITRIWHLLNDIDIKIITQQYIVRPSGYALADLYFPQFDLVVEVNESYHLKRKELDNIREKDIVNAVNFKVKVIDTSKDINSIHKQIDDLVDFVNTLKKKGFKKWDYENEFNNKQYIDKGYIDVKDNAVFCRSVDAYNCFGNNYKALMRGGAIHKYIHNVNIWFPKLYQNGEWINDITFDENTIYESNVDFIKNAKAVKDWLATDRYIRYVFAQSKDNLGRTLYRFLGEYTLNREKTIKEQKAVWERTNTRVKTFKYKGSDNL